MGFHLLGKSKSDMNIFIYIHVCLQFIFPQTTHENRIYSLRIIVSSRYPDEPPDVWFINKIVLPGVNETGKVRAVLYSVSHKNGYQDRRGYNFKTKMETPQK